MSFNVAEQYIAEAETLLGASLPPDYRAFMMRTNGGSVEAGDDDWELYPIRDSSDRKRVARSANDLVSEMRSWREWVGFPDDVVAIAHNGAGDCLVFRRGAGGFDDAVFCWSHESRQLARVADSFTALLDGQ